MSLVKRNRQQVKVLQVQLYDKPDMDVRIGIPFVHCHVKYQREGPMLHQRVQNKLQTFVAHNPCVVGSNGICESTVEGKSRVISCALYQARYHAERRPTYNKRDQHTESRRYLDLNDDNISCRWDHVLVNRCRCACQWRTPWSKYIFGTVLNAPMLDVMGANCPGYVRSHCPWWNHKDGRLSY